MHRFLLCSACCVIVASLAHSFVFADEPLPPIPPIKRLLPPEGVKLPEEVERTLRERLVIVEARLSRVSKELEEKRRVRFGRGAWDYLPDVEIFTKAVRYAIELHEFYDVAKDVAKAKKLLDEAERRIAELEQGTHSWTKGPGLTVRGYPSGIDDSVQPYGVVFPDNYDPERKQPYPVYVWLHGRGDKSTDMHFTHERMTQVGQLGPVDAIVVHPFGRHCIGFKSAGEVDVVRSATGFAVDAALEEVPVDLERTVLIGFSMGGAGTWLIGAHKAGIYDVIAPGAGFAETAKYTHTDPATIPWYERKLWGLNDVPCYTRNLFNAEVIAYSGEHDKQIQAARVMEEAFQAEGRKLTHLIGPGVEHKYEPKTLAALKQRIKDSLEKVKPTDFHTQLQLQTRTLRYSRVGWLGVHGLERHWEDARVDALASGEEGARECILTTKGVTALDLTQYGFRRCTIDGQPFRVGKEQTVSIAFEKLDGKWSNVNRFKGGLQKRPKLQGPIDDAFVDPFIVVTPSGTSTNPLVERWVKFELDHFLQRWKALMRGDPNVKRDVDVTEEDFDFHNLVCFGDPDSNAIIRKAFEKLPITWKSNEVVAGSRTWSADSHVPALIYPNPLWKDDGFETGIRRVTQWLPRYLVINSGLTFREAHDKTNSQQNPKLPDWAVIDLSQLPDDKAPGRIAAAGFFDEQWQYQEPEE